MSMKLDDLGAWKRSHFLDELSPADEGKEVHLMGWVNSRRDHGGVIFVDLRDYKGITQVVFATQHQEEAFTKADALRKMGYCCKRQGPTA